MMNKISSKTAEVAEPLYRYALNLQMFAEDEGDGTPNLEDSPEYRDDAREFNAKMDKFTQDRAPKEGKPAEIKDETPADPVKADDVANPEVVEPGKPKQDPETNKAFQEMRQRLEAAEKEKIANAEKAKKADELIAQQYGASHGIYTVEQYEQRLQQEREQADNERYEQAGLTPEEIQKLRDYDQLKQETAQEQEARQVQENTAKWNSLYAAYPDLVESSKLFTEGKDPEWFTDEMKAEIARGASPIAAYRNAHFETILQNTLGNAKEVAKQEALDKLNSKDHLAPNAATGGDVEHVEIDEDTMRAYRALNKGKTDAQIRAWHKKHAM